MKTYLEKFGPVLLLILFSFFAFSPFLFFGRTFFDQEQVGFFYVISYYVSTSIQSGLPLAWISGYYGGVPASLDQLVSGWFPLNLALFSYLSFFTAHHLSIIIGTAAGLLLSYGFGRSLGWLRTSSISLALMYFLATTYAWLFIGTISAHAFSVLPGLLWALWVASTKRTYLIPITGGALLLGMGFLAGFVQIIFYEYILAGLFALYLDWSTFSRTLSFIKNIKVSYTYTAITLGGLIIGFPQWFPSAFLIDSTIRTSTYAIQNAYSPFPTELITLLLPPYFTVPFFGGGSSAGFYIGTLGIVSAILALRYYRTSLVTFFAGLYGFVLGFAFHLFPFSWINEHLPPFANMGGNFRWMIAAAFPLAFLGAAGIEGILRNPDRIPRHTRIWIIALCGIVTLALILAGIAISISTHYINTSPALLNHMITWYTEGRTLSFPNEHYVTVLTETLNQVGAEFSLGNVKYIFGTLLWLGAALIFALTFFKEQFRPHVPTFIIAFMVLTASGNVVLKWSDTTRQEAILRKPELARIITDRESDRRSYRIMGYVVGDGLFLQRATGSQSPMDITTLQIDTLVNNSAMYFNIERMDGMEPYRTLRHNRLLDTVIAYDPATYVFDDESPNLESSALDQLYNRDVQRKVTVEEKLKDLPKRLPLISMMNVKYLYSPYKLSDASLKLVAQIPVGSESRRAQIFLYENTHVLPRIYVAKEVLFASGEREALLGVVREKDFSRHTWIECNDCASTSGPAKIIISQYETGSLLLTVQASDDTWLVFSESAFPGWKATIDGTPTPIYTANYLFQTIRVPKGEHTVSFVYEDIAVQKTRSAFRLN